jgi:hypothetical protein
MGGKHVQCDSGIVPLIVELNFPGLATKYSCQGITAKDIEHAESEGYALGFHPAYVSFTGSLAKKFMHVVLEEMQSADEPLICGLEFESRRDMVMRWHPADFPRVLQYAKAAATKLRIAEKEAA